jgi:predicted nuclease of restriction endonuclease-like (RecB) superfamily
MEQLQINQIADQIVTLMRDARTAAARELNDRLLRTYWEIGCIIVEQEQNGSIKAQYGTRLLAELSKELTNSLGKGFSRSNLFCMRNFYIAYPNFPDVSGKLTWSHYCELINVSDSDARSFYERECANSRWSVRELKRQINTSMFERLLLSDGKANKETVLELSRQGIAMEKAEDILKDPYVFEFLGAREKKPILEKDLERRLIRHIEDFLLELGRGFMFVGSQQRVTLGNTHYYVDMVFYNKSLKAYVLIDLKMDEFKAEHAGQMNMYLNYYKTEVNEDTDSPPIGIILCKSNDEIVAEYALGGVSNQVFASRYVYYIPDKEHLINEVKSLLEEEETAL